MKAPQVLELATSGIFLKLKTSVSPGGFKLPTRNILNLGTSKNTLVYSVKFECTKLSLILVIIKTELDSFLDFYK